MGSAAIGEAVLEATALVRAANPAARYCCDPVIGDVGRGVFVREGIPEFIKSRAVPVADVLTPNQFELDYLSGRVTKTLAEALAAISIVHDMGPRHILVTSLHVAETPEDQIDLIASGADGVFRVRTPRLPIVVNGAGDAVAALFFAHLLESGVTAIALSRAVSSIFGILKATSEKGSREILLIEAQEELVAPSELFEAEQVA